MWISMGLLLCADDFEKVRDKVQIFRKFEKRTPCDFCWKFSEYDVVLMKDEVSERNVGVYPRSEKKEQQLPLREIRDFTLARNLNNEEMKVCNQHLGSDHKVETVENNSYVVSIRCITHNTIMMFDD